MERIAKASNVARLSLLEIGAGRGDLPLAAHEQLARQGIELQVTLLDRIPYAPATEYGASVAADAMRLPFRDNAFDVVSCCLLAHHFEPDELTNLAASALRVCRRAVLINDVVRSRVNLALTYAGFPLFRSRITRHDAVASVRRAYTREEMESILSKVPAARMEITTHYLYRMGVLLWK